MVYACLTVKKIRKIKREKKHKRKSWGINRHLGLLQHEVIRREIFFYKRKEERLKMVNNKKVKLKGSLGFREKVAFAETESHFNDLS